MKLLRKVYNKLFKPFNIETCNACDHEKIFHHPDRALSGYPGITCYGEPNNPFKSLTWNFEKRCRCGVFIKKGNLEYLEYKAKEAGII